MNNLAIETLRFLSVDAINKANSGHPGLPMGAASMCYVLFKEHLKFSPKDPSWVSRDRFIMSGGHGSALYYSLLNLFGYDIKIEDLKEFRQMGSKTPGHPEIDMTEGVDMSTGPLGQGLASAVGFAVAEEFNREKYKAISNYTYVLCGDGDLMEGISSEAASLAGHLELSKLIVLYDSNDITIDGRVDITFTEDVKKRYESYNWNVIEVKDGNDYDEVNDAIKNAKRSDKPTLIIVKTIIGYGSVNKSDTSSVHGSPLGEEETKLTKEAFGWDKEKTFYVSDKLRTYLQDIIDKKNKEYDKWIKDYPDFRFTDYYVELDELKEVARGDDATRNHSNKIINKLSERMLNLIGGSADLGASNKTLIKNDGYFKKESPTERNIAYGIREHAMAAIVNGLTLYGGIKAFCSTFLVFSDYLKPSIRLAALMDINSIFIFTHDSISVGEDGPTHQPVEQLIGLRSIPNLRVFRPCDGIETAVSYYQSLKEGPSAIILSRQNLKELDIDRQDELKGAYIASKEEKELELILLASGSEVALALEVKERLKNKYNVRVVSFLSFEVFNSQSKEYIDKVLPSNVRKRYAIEKASSYSWYKYIGLDGKGTFVDKFGKSAKEKDLDKYFSFDIDSLVNKVKEYMDE